MWQLADSCRMIVWMTDVDDNFVYLNQSAAALIGAGVPLSVSDWARFIHPDDLPNVRRVYREAKQAHAEYQCEYRVVRSDGGIRWMLGSGAPRHDAAGEFIGYTGTVLEVTEQHEAHERLAASEANQRLMTEYSSDLISHCDRNGIYLFVSPSYTRALGLEPADLVGRSVYDFVHPDDWHIVRSEVQRQVQDGAESSLIEIRKRHRDGHYIWMGTKARIMLDAVTKAKTGSVSVSRDITSERHARAELKRSEERFRSLTQLSSDWYWEMDEAERFTFFSDGLQRVFGIAPEYALGKTGFELALCTQQPDLETYRSRVAAREPFRNLVFIVRDPVGGGTRHACISGEPVYEDGIFKGYRGIGRDISAEKELLLQLARLAEENKALIEHSPDIMVLFDASGRILRANRAVKRVIGYEPEELTGRHHLEFVTPGTREETKALVAAIGDASDTVPDLENCWLRKDGSAVHLSWAVRRMDDSGLTYATARDVTERRRTRAKLRRANQRLNTILESIGDAFFSVDRNWRLTYANRKAIVFVGVERDAAIGKVIWDIVPGIRNSPIFEHYQHAMRSGEKVSFEAVYEPTGAWVEVRAYPHEGGLSVFFHDITARRVAEQAVRESEQRLREMLEITPAGYFLTDAEGIVQDVNPALCALSGYAKDEFIGKDIKRFLPSCPLTAGLAASGAGHAMETVIRHKDGRPVYVLLNLSAKSDTSGPRSLTAFVTDITERKQAEARLQQLASHDPLTGLPNRSLIGQRVESLLEAGPADETLAVMFIDLDGFKQVNDSMGHASGDGLLRQVALRLQCNTRTGDVIARLGGDEFVVAAHCPDGKVSAEAIAQRLLAALTAPFDIEGQEVFVSASIGICMLAADTRSRDLLFQNADTAMYRAKAAGRNCYRFFEAEMSVEAKTRMTLEHTLRRALERREFELHYQPRVKLKSMGVVGMEALIRWNHPQLGSILPMQFIPIAEDRGLIESIGQWVLEEACLQTRRLMDKFGRPLHVSVNLSARQLKCRNLTEQVEAALAKAGLPAGMLELELTESALVEDIDESVDVMKRLKKLGVLLSVDDFGTGYSGLSYLNRFPFDILKLDRSFVYHQPEGLSSFEFVKALVDMAHALKLSVVAEGVETGEILHLLRDAACDEGQGYLFARPLPLPELEAFLARLPSRT
ncbi:PAS domain S-box protein [Noviherbaspirillum sp. UKPF54]|uniref:sensor domain-containing protein n=1 Tax=Noviherbaspirillum sp. UKPF54 TaxID=2601898 RepID=UPI00143CE6ED|nr:PAS domain S-box protein [Noviherbaspirillum sp. UKPF54]